jgi:hypothetical protein
MALSRKPGAFPPLRFSWALSMILSKGLCFFGAKVSSFRVCCSLPVYNTVSLISFAGLTRLKSLRLGS